MKDFVKRLIKVSPFYRPLFYLRQHQLRRRAARSKRRVEDGRVAEWERQGKPIPPPYFVKQRILKQYAKRYGLKILVETGTYYGDTVEAMKHSFEKIYSIELSEELHAKAKERFAADRNIKLIQGDSGKVLGEIVKELKQPALFWLDGHYSGGVTAKGASSTPIYEELTHILNAQALDHVIIIDDAREFGADPSYPTIEELKDLVRSKRNSTITVEDDSIRIVPAK